MKVDHHLHAEFSYDSRIKAGELAQRALELGYSLIAITEHLDLLPWELSHWGLPAFMRYIDHLRPLQSKFAPKGLRIIRGVEVGDFHRVKSFADEFLAELDFELRLGSVHFLSDGTNVAIPFKRPLRKEDSEDYYKQNLTLTENCVFDVLGHLGVHKRYLTEEPPETHCEGVIRDIFSALISRNIALEINFSSLRKPYGRILPDQWQIDLYRDMGGTLFSIGSDSHLLEQFDQNYELLPSWLFSGEVRLIHADP